MFGQLKSAKTKEEWEAFLKELQNKEKYILGIESFKYYPLGEEMIKQIDFMMKLDVTFILDENGIRIDTLNDDNKKKYEKNKKKRLTVFKEYLESKDEIAELNLKYHLLTTTWDLMRRLLNFDENNIGTKIDKQRFDKYLNDYINAANMDEKLIVEIEYAKYVKKRFFQKFPYLLNKPDFILRYFSMIDQMIFFAKDGKDAQINKLNDGIDLLKRFTGNPIEKRKSGSFEKYKRIIAIIKCMDKKFKRINGVETKACDLEKVNTSTFNRFKNRNIQRYQKIYDDISEKELDAVYDIIRKEYF